MDARPRSYFIYDTLHFDKKKLSVTFYTPFYFCATLELKNDACIYTYDTLNIMQAM